jgi:hypothetical protein
MSDKEKKMIQDVMDNVRADQGQHKGAVFGL